MQSVKVKYTNEDREESSLSKGELLNVAAVNDGDASAMDYSELQ